MLIKIFFTILIPLLLPLDCSAFDHSYKQWAEFLKGHIVVDGNLHRVRYHEVAVKPIALQKVLQEFALVTRAEFDQWPPQQRLAFLINSYNAFTIELIREHWRAGKLESIRDIGSLFQSAWKKKFFQLLGEKMYLDRLEHEIARKDFSEPRIHFAFNCASLGCPNLALEPFRGETLDAQLDAAALSFLRDSERNRWNQVENRFEVSKIFDWYGKDFKSWQSFVAERIPGVPESAKKCAQANNCLVKFLDYDWSLNRAG